MHCMQLTVLRPHGHPRERLRPTHRHLAPDIDGQRLEVTRLVLATRLVSSRSRNIYC